MKKIKTILSNGFKTLGHSITTNLYYWDGKPEIGYLLVQNYKMFWLNGSTVIGSFVTLEEARECAVKLGIKL